MPGKKLSESKRIALTPQLILDAALRLTAGKGAGSLTVRALGAELGADPTAVYRHFRDKDEIILALVDLLARESMTDLPPGANWRDDLHHVGQRTVRVFLKHPAIGEFAAVRVARGAGEFRAVETLFTIFLDAGLQPASAAVYVRAFGDSILSYAGMRAAQLLLDPEVKRLDEQAWARDYQVLPADEYPRLAAHSSHLIGIDDEQILSTLIDAFADSAEAQIRREAAESGHKGGSSEQEATGNSG